MLHASIAVYTASVVAFYVVARYRYPLVPMLALFAGAAVVELPARWHRRSKGGLAGALALLALAALVTNWPLLPPADLRVLTRFNFARTLQSAGRVDEAMTEYRRVLELDPNHAGSHTNLGVLAAERGERSLALRHFQSAAASAPGAARGHVNLGVELMAQQRPEEAIASFRRAVALDPLDAGARFNLGTALAAAGRSEEAIAHLEEVVRLEPGNALARNNLGILLATSGRAAEAIPHFAAALRLAPDFRDAAENLARARELAAAAGR